MRVCLFGAFLSLCSVLDDGVDLGRHCYCWESRVADAKVKSNVNIFPELAFLTAEACARALRWPPIHLRTVTSFLPPKRPKFLVVI